MRKQLSHSKMERHRILCEKLHETYQKKNQDYGDSFGESVQKYGLMAAWIRIGDKFHRAEHLLMDESQQKVQDESLQDTLLDMANYCIMTAVELENRKEQRP